VRLKAGSRADLLKTEASNRRLAVVTAPAVRFEETPAFLEGVTPLRRTRNRGSDQKQEHDEPWYVARDHAK
jgi:hypothetical protein